MIGTTDRGLSALPAPARAGATLSLLALAGLVSVSAAGCQTMMTKSSPTPPGSAKAHGSPEPPGPKTEFHKEVSATNQFNVHVEMAKALESQGNFEAAIAAYQKAVDVCAQRGTIFSGGQLGPANQALAQRKMAAAYDRMGKFALAETHYTEALKHAPNDPKIWNDTGYSYYLQSRYADAERALKTAETFEPGNARTLNNLGLALAAQGKSDEALAVLSRANGPAAGHANLGFILAAMGKTPEAREHYRQALALQPTLPAAREALARIDAKPQAPATALARATPPTGAAAPATIAPTSDTKIKRASTSIPPR